MKNLLVIAGVMVFLFAPVTGAKVFEGKGYSLEAVYRLSYDSNFMRYSPTDRNRFFNNAETYPTYASTLDDLRSDFKFISTYNYTLMKGLSGRASLTANFAAHARNPINNLGWLSLVVRQDVSRRFSVLLNHFYEPYYYIRDYQDVHTNSRRHCDFALQREVVKAFWGVNEWMELSGRGEYKKYAYNEYFTEYDGHYSSASLESVFRYGQWRFSALYGLGTFNNTGFNAADLVTALGSEDSETGNSDFQEDNYSASGQYSFRIKKQRSRVRLEVGFEDRYYQTDLSPNKDPIHSGRRDVNLTSTLSWTTSITKTLSIECAAAYYSRDSRAPDPLVSRVKDYQRWEFGVEATYKLR